MIKTNACSGHAAAPVKLACALRTGGCVGCNVEGLLREVGLRPTRQRIALGRMLFARGHRHITAEILHEEAIAARVPVSLATVYNALHQFTEVGLLREIAVEGGRTYFDTNVSDHHHFLLEDENRLVDIGGETVGFAGLPMPLEGTVISRVDVLIRLRRRPAAR
ncbi:iron response transcriptional regulator IrrA [Ancylobacter sp. TS-1]|uniref:iron response transcriptional regulator IrrA n=1 Tax=Ancylobacter sp. TS-1 TaxID=1850374 RepID=UPI001265CF6B|nr:Fur family transcriptional regulator [Ancylobacter sp. TS-1]QFR32665.1 transcriptional repressor [Ancylobacter sp. TS-1]